MTASNRNGFLLLDKKMGLTSFDSLARVKEVFATGKVGHIGTLDKFASGLLLVLVGRAVKLNFLFKNCIKEYFGTVSFGTETDTLDPEGAVIASGKVPSIGEVEVVLGNFRGDILQSPPAYSAIHINGRRAHELAREGKAPMVKQRPVSVFELEIISWAPPIAEIRAVVSSGTYIRSLVRDIALAVGSRAHLSALKRTRIGPFRLDEAVAHKPTGDDGQNLSKALRPLDKALFDALSVPSFFIDEHSANGFLNGRPLEALLKPPGFSNDNIDINKPGTAGVFRENNPNELLGVIENHGGKWFYVYVFRAN